MTQNQAESALLFDEITFTLDQIARACRRNPALSGGSLAEFGIAVRSGKKCGATLAVGHRSREPTT